MTFPSSSFLFSSSAIGKSNQMIESHQLISESKVLDPMIRFKTEVGKKFGKKISPNAVDATTSSLLGMIRTKSTAPHTNFDTNRYGFKMIGLPKSCPC